MKLSQSRTFQTADSKFLRGLPPVMSSPPTVSIVSDSDEDEITDGVHIWPRRLDSDPSNDFDVSGDPFFYASGCPDGKLYEDAINIARTNYLIDGSSQAARWRTTWFFQTDAARVDIYTRAYASSLAYNIVVLNPQTGQFEPVSASDFSDSVTTNSRYRIILDFGTSEPRLIGYRPQNTVFGGVFIPPTATIQKPNMRLRKRFGVLSDSTGQGANGVPWLNAWPQQCAEMLDMECWNLSIGGTGYTTGSGSAADRLQDVIDADLDYCVVAFGQNDRAGSTTQEILDAAESFLRSAIAACPQTMFILHGIHMTSQAYSLTAGPLDQGLRTLAETLGLPFVSLRDPQNLLATAEPWVSETDYVQGQVVAHEDLSWTCLEANSDASFTASKWIANSFLTGTGNAGSTAGDGNADVIVSDDGVHYSQEGHNSQALFEASQLLPIVSTRRAL